MDKVGIIGGSGLTNMSGLEFEKEMGIETKYGHPSSDILKTSFHGKEIFFLARHGREHTIPPHKVNYRANIQALKDLGCTHIIATSACGSLKEDYKRGDFVILDQFIDFTKNRINTFVDSFEPHIPIHAEMADPFSKEIRAALLHAANSLELSVHDKGTVVSIEGPRFSTRAESRMFRLCGGDVINMTIATECALAKEAGIPYACIALVTDYDCWKEDETDVTWQAVLEAFNKRLPELKNILFETLKY